MLAMTCAALPVRIWAGFVEGDVAHPVQPVLDAPVASFLLLAAMMDGLGGPGL